ncbi:MAG: flagellar biosynthetic protein FliQ [Planctomycetota bacterium]
MNSQDTIDMAQSAIRVCILVGGPILLASMIIGLIAGLFQALTQIQDQAISFVPKIVGLMILISLMLPWSMNHLGDFASQLFGKPYLSLTNGLTPLDQSKENRNGFLSPDRPRQRTASVANSVSNPPPIERRQFSIPNFSPRFDSSMPKLRSNDSSSQIKTHRNELPRTNQPFRLPSARPKQKNRSSNLSG